MIVIPDKYNTGCSDNVKAVDAFSDDAFLKAFGGLAIMRSTDSCKLNFNYGNFADGNYVIENIDFTGKTFQYLGATEYDITITFNNCKFSGISTGANVKTVMNNCTIERINARDVTCNSCQFGHSYIDPIKPFNNSTFNNCYIVDLQYFFASPDNPNASAHIDGMQLSGNQLSANSAETVAPAVENVRFYNCRFEIPTYYIAEGNKAGMNDCIFVQPEFSDANNITFENIITNGANCQFSAHSNRDKTNKDLLHTVTNSYLKNCRMGEGSILGPMIAIDSNIGLQNVGISTDLYIGSSWQDGKGTHFSVTNDSNFPRKLAVVTDKGIQTFDIPAYPKASVTNKADNKYAFKDYPIDCDICVAAKKYAICYDVTAEPKQIRYVNYTNERVVFDESSLEKYSKPVTVVSSGECGKKVTYSLTSDGLLTISGEGAMTSFHSALMPPWAGYNVTKVLINEGVTTVGTQAFKYNHSLTEVKLPKTLTKIDSRAFAGCSSINLMNLPASLTTIGTASFEGCFPLTLNYLGNDWKTVSGGDEYSSKVTMNSVPDTKKGIFYDLVASEFDWKYIAAKYAYDHQIMVGKDKTSSGQIIFDPDGNITRAEFVQVLYNLEGKPATKYQPIFSDVTEKDWYQSAVLWAYENKIAVGKGSFFDAKAPITREEVVTMLKHFADLKGVKTNATAELSAYSDVPAISSWAVDNVKWAVGAKVVKGKNDKIDPKGYATRAECATMIRNF